MEKRKRPQRRFIDTATVVGPAKLTSLKWKPESTHVVENQLRHLKHSDLFPAAEDFPQLIIRVDLGFVGLILEVVTADIVPEFAGDFGPGDRVIPNNSRELFIRLDGLHESGTRLPFSFGFSFSHDLTYIVRWGKR
jgi:hypothetical protein